MLRLVPQVRRRQRRTSGRLPGRRRLAAVLVVDIHRERGDRRLAVRAVGVFGRVDRVLLFGEAAAVPDELVGPRGGDPSLKLFGDRVADGFVEVVYVGAADTREKRRATVSRLDL